MGPGTVRTLRGKGMPRLRSNGRVDGQGDLMVHVDVVVPTKLDREQTEDRPEIRTAEDVAEGR